VEEEEGEGQEKEMKKKGGGQIGIRIWNRSGWIKKNKNKKNNKASRTGWGSGRWDVGRAKEGVGTGSGGGGWNSGSSLHTLGTVVPAKPLSSVSLSFLLHATL
jgi:hypothetical protein